MGFPDSSVDKESGEILYQDTLVQSLGWEDPLEKGMTTHFSILPWEIPWISWQAIVHEVATSQTGLSN